MSATVLKGELALVILNALICYLFSGFSMDIFSVKFNKVFNREYGL